MRCLDIKARASLQDDRQLIAPECLDFFDIALRIEQGHMRDVGCSQTKVAWPYKFVMAFGVRQIGRQKLRQEGRAAASSRHCENELSIGHLGCARDLP